MPLIGLTIVTRRVPKPFQLRSTRVGDYRLLGLPWGESDIVKIRDSVTASASEATIKKTKILATGDSSQRRTKVALAGYRLLDPRLRRELYDRVQLSCIIYRGLDERPREPEITSRLPLLATHHWEVKQSHKPHSMNEPLDINASPSGEFIHIDSSLSDARDIVRMLNESEIQEQNQLTGVLRWLQVVMRIGSFYRMRI